MIKDYPKFLRISQVLNHSFGTDGPGHQHVNGMNVRIDPVDDKLLKARCVMTVTYRTDQMLHELNRKHREEAVAMIKGAMERIVDDYNNQFDDTLRLSMDDQTIDESTEFFHVSQYVPVSRAFYRVTTLISVD